MSRTKVLNYMATISRVSAEHYLWGDNCDGWHLVKTDRLSVIQERVPPGAGEIRHLHNMAEQFFFVISGVATIEVDGTVNTLRPMQGIHIKPGIAHQLENQGDVDLEFIVTSTPPSHDDRLLAPAFNSRSDTQN